MSDKDSVVIELQRRATNPEVDIIDLLRHALAVATKLNINDFLEWINHELKGYPLKEVPEYRRVIAQIKVRTRFNDFVPVIVANPTIADALCNVPLDGPISELQSLLNQTTPSADLEIPLLPEQIMFLLKNQKPSLNLPPVRIINRPQIEGIIDAVRTVVLEWSLKLEKEGILGHGMTFSAKEKERAAASAEIHIQNFQGILGNVSQSTVFQKLDMNIKKGDLRSLERQLTSAGVPQKDIEELREAITGDGQPKEENKFGSRVSAWIGKMITKAASGALEMGAEKLAGLLTESLKAYYGWPPSL